MMIKQDYVNQINLRGTPALRLTRLRLRQSFTLVRNLSEDMISSNANKTLLDLVLQR